MGGATRGVVCRRPRLPAHVTAHRFGDTPLRSTPHKEAPADHCHVERGRDISPLHKRWQRWAYGPGGHLRPRQRLPDSKNIPFTSLSAGSLQLRMTTLAAASMPGSAPRRMTRGDDGSAGAIRAVVSGTNDYETTLAGRTRSWEHSGTRTGSSGVAFNPFPSLPSRPTGRQALEW
jgi:hypothetical protein